MSRDLNATADAAAEHYLGVLAAMAQQLRGLADEVERQGRVDSPRDPSPYTTAAADVVQSLLAGVAGLRTYPLILRAAEADRTRAEASAQADDRMVARDRYDEVARDAKELLDLFIEGGYIEADDEALVNRLHKALTEEPSR